MDIQKLFEESTGYSTSSWVVFDKELNKYVAIDGELILTVEEMNLDFELFQKGIAIGGQAAKANAVPEGFVLMPKEPTREIYRTFYDAFYSAAGNTAQCFKVAYKAIVEAQEPNHD